MTPEHKIQSDILVSLSKNHCTPFRINVGKGKTADGRYFSTGVKPGYPDISGFIWKSGKAFFIEVKTKTGRPRSAQIQFHKMLTAHHIIHGIARSADDALKIVNEELIGYGFKDYGGKK